MFSHFNNFLFHLLSVLLSMTPYFLILVGGSGGHGGIKMASASTPSANEAAKDLILVQTVQHKSINLRKNGM